MFGFSVKITKSPTETPRTVSPVIWKGPSLLIVLLIVPLIFWSVKVPYEHVGVVENKNTGQISLKQLRPGSYIYFPWYKVHLVRCMQEQRRALIDVVTSDDGTVQVIVDVTYQIDQAPIVFKACKKMVYELLVNPALCRSLRESAATMPLEDVNGLWPAEVDSRWPTSGTSPSILGALARKTRNNLDDRLRPKGIFVIDVNIVQASTLRDCKTRQEIIADKQLEAANLKRKGVEKAYERLESDLKTIEEIYQQWLKDLEKQ